MGNITTDFITATKKIHADVRAILTTLHVIGRDVKAINDECSAKGNQGKTGEKHQGVGTLHSAKENANTYESKQYALDKLRFRLEKKAFRVARWTVVILAIYTGLTGYQSCQSRRAAAATETAAVAAKSAADTAHDTLVVSNRPWVKIKHRIIQPLTFDVSAWKGPIAKMVVEDTLENVGPSIALNVFSWEDVIPVDNMGSIKTARARQDQWCDANRHRQPGDSLSGYVLFPKDPFVQDSTVGPFMEVVNKAADASPEGLRGKTGFVLVGCVAYRSSFEPSSAPAHETKFIYRLGEPMPGGAIQPYVVPHRVADKLQLVTFPDGFSAD